MITSSGAWCNICEKPILDGMVNCFAASPDPEATTLHSCDDCKKYWNNGVPVDDWPDSKLKFAIIKKSDEFMANNEN